MNQLTRPLKCVYATAEVAGFAKTGGLADVAASLPPTLASFGHECIIVMPLYRCIRTGKHIPEPTNHVLHVPIRNKMVSGSIWRAALPGSDVPVYMIAQPDYFERDNPKSGKSLYQYIDEEGRTRDYPDNCERYVFFCRAILELLRLLNFWPDVLHCNDWHTSLVPVYLKEVYWKQLTSAFRPHYERIRTLLTIHNIAYQGLFWHYDMPITGLSWDLFNYRQLEFYGRINFLKGGIVFADLINAVSPTYAKEIQTQAHGCGLHGVLYERRNDLYGIVNGVDYSVWNPMIDRHIAARYDTDSVEIGKAACKRALQNAVGLPVEPQSAVLGMISRLVEQKGIELVLGSAPEFLQQDVQLIVLGIGDQVYMDRLRKLRDQFPQKVAVKFELDEPLAHQIEAGADMFLMPSLFEPCGLNQLYSLKYGTVPIVRKTGGLSDTVVDATPEAVAAGQATGFSFQLPTSLALSTAIQRALTCYRTQPIKWLEIMRTGMRQDWSWGKSARQYEELYRKMLDEHTESA